MKKSLQIIIGVAILVIIVGLVFIYNTIETREEAVERTWTPLVSGLDLRYAAVPSLAREIEIYIAKEDETTRDLKADQKAYIAAKTLMEKAKAANDLEIDIDKIIIEAKQLYPGIESYYQFMAIEKDFQASELRILSALNDYNQAVEKFNDWIRKFPNNLIASILGLERGVYIKNPGIKN